MWLFFHHMLNFLCPKSEGNFGLVSGMEFALLKKCIVAIKKVSQIWLEDAAA